ncbi:unnamed protein product [Trichobilharzia szidati]|nr:unnamed protein product [Trichobilharzia szidati]
MVKSERFKNKSKRRSGSSSSLDSHLHKKSSSTVSIEKAISCLGEQIQLPVELYQAFHVKPPTEYAVKTSHLSNGSADPIGRLTQICNIDPSLIGSSISNHNNTNNKNRCHYCFQVMSPSQEFLMTSSTSGLQPNREERKSTDKNYLTRSMSGETSTTSSPIITNMYDNSINDRNNSPSKASSSASASAAATRTPVTLQSQGSTTEETVNIPFVIYNYSCQSALERDRWVQYLKRLVNPGQDTQRRKENCLNVWVQEAKGLTVKNRYFCTILVNGTICARTTVKQMTDMLFWGEEFDLSGLTDCSYLTIEIWKACEIGKSTSSPSSHRHRNNSPSNRRRGDDAKNTSPPAAMRKAMMTCTRAVAEDGSVSPPDFTAFRNSAILDDFSIMNNGDTDGGCAGQKRRKFKTSSSTSKVDKKPTLVATININLLDISNSGDVESWYSPDSANNPNASNNSIMLSSCLKQQQPSDPHEHVPLQRKSKSKTKSRSSGDSITNCVQIRVKIRYRALTVLPLTSYARLEANLCQFQMPKTVQRQEHQLLQMTGSTLLFNGSNSLTTSLSQRPDLIQLLSSLDPWLNVKAKAELAGAIVVLQQARGQVIEFLASLILCEVRKQTDPNMVLRANSIATKATEIYLRLVGGSYLPTILSDFVKIVISGMPVDPLLMINNRQQPIDYEVDISKVQTSSQLAQNQVNLLSLVELVWKKILTSEDKFPEQFRALFIEIRQHLDGSKGSYLSSSSMNSNVSSGNVSVVGVGVDNGNGTLCEHVISACLFLRYICPAILSPSLFNLTHEFPSEPRVLRAFTLVAKTIQTLANFSLFSGSKEAYMKFMNQFVTDQLPEMRRFLHSISMPIGKASMHSTSSPSQKSLNSNSTAVLKPINNNNNNNISRHATGDNNHSNRNSQNGSTPHSLHMISSSDENLLKVSKLSSTHRLGGEDDRGCGGSSTSSENRIGNSQSHHGGFMGENNGLSTNTSVPVSISSRGKINKSHDVKSPMKQQSSQELSKHKTTYQEGSTTLNCIALPPLPSCESQHLSSHQPQNHLGLRDHVDLPLCLALCHLQLCEAIDKVPEEKRQSDINELKTILDEISMFLTSGKDPQPNWWRQKKANTNSEQDNRTSSIIVINTGNTTTNDTTTGITKKVENFHNTSRSHSKSPHPLVKKNTSQTTTRTPATTTDNTTTYIGEINNKSTISLDDEKITPLTSTPMLSAPSSTTSLKQQITVPEKKRKPTGSNKNHYKTMPNSNVEVIVSKSQQNHHTEASTAVTTPTTSPTPTNIPPERIIRCDSIEIIKVPYTTNTTDGFYHSIEVKKNRFPSTNSSIQPKTSQDFIVDSKLAKDTFTDSSLKVDHRKWRKGRVESPQKKKSHESVVIYRETNDTTTTSGERLHAKLDSPVSAEMNPTEFSEDPSVMSSNCVLGNYSISSGYHTISSRCGNNQPVSTPNHNILLTSISDEISSSTSVNNPLYTCHSLKQINNSNVSNYDNSIEYFSDKDTVLLTNNNNNNNSVGGCNNSSSSSSKKPNSNSSRRHTYVNLGNSHETNRLIDTIKNGDHHSHHQQRSDQTVELDRRNWAPPVYILPDERRNRRATLTTTYPNTNEVNLSGNSTSSKEHIHQSTSDPQEFQHGSASSSSSMRRLETKLERIKFGTKEIPRTIGAPAGKRPALFPKENNTPAIIDIRSELDASQARLAEAQARLLANEAERIQLLRSWRSELIKQSQLINASSLNQNQTTTVVYENPTEPQQQYASSLRITHSVNKDPAQLSLDHNDGDDGENDDNSDRDYNDMITNEPRSLSVIPLINTNSLQRQDLHHYYAESIYDYEDSELMHCNTNNNNNNVDPDQHKKSKRSAATTDRYIHIPMSNSNNGGTVGRHFGAHQNTPGSSVKSQRSYSNRPRMGASAIVSNLHDHSTTSSASVDNNYQQSTLPGRGKLTTQQHHWNNGNHKIDKNTNPNTSSETMMTTPSSTDLDEFYRLSRSPSTPGLCINNNGNNHSKYSPRTTVPSMTTTTTPPATTPQQITGRTDEEFARQIQAIIYENNQHLCSK